MLGASCSYFGFLLLAVSGWLLDIGYWLELRAIGVIGTLTSNL